MSDALTYGGIDLINGEYGVGIDSDFGSPQAVTSAVRSLFLDGSVVSGKFSDNRTMTLTVEIRGTSRADLSAKADALAYQVDQPTNTLTYTPSGGLPTVWDTFRGQMTAVWDYVGEYNYFRRYQIVMPALPFGRTPSTSTLSASSGASVAIDTFEEASPPTVTASASPSGLTQATLANAGAMAPYAGTYLANGGFALSGSTGWWSFGTTFAAKNLGSNTVAAFVYNDDGVTHGYWSTQTFTLTLSSSGGSSTWTVTPNLAAGAGWHRVLFNLAATPNSTTGSGYSASAVTGYTLRMDGTSASLAGVSFSVDQLAAYPTGYGTATSADAGSYTMSPVAGSARTPMNLRVDRGGTSTLTDLLVFQAPPEAASNYQPLLVGSTPYSTPAGVHYDGTFTVIASIKAASQGTAQSVAVSIQQKQGASNVGSAWTSGTVTSTSGDAYVVLGEVTLPLVGTAVPNAGVTYSVTVTTGSTVVLDIFLLDTRGALVFVGPTPVAASKYLFIAAPQAATGVGGVYSGSVSDLSDATSLSASTRMSGGQMSFNPGSNTLVVCSTDASSDLVVTATYSPRWLTERTS